MKLPQLSVITYDLVIISGQTPLSETSLVQVILGFGSQLSLASVILLMLGEGIFAVFVNIMFCGLVPIGAIVSFTLYVCTHS